MTTSDTLVHAFEDSVLVVAHPDDEILWFGSIAPKVDKIVICFLNDPIRPKMAEARRQTLAAHPWRDRMVSLELDETDAFSRANWPLPETTKFGLRIVKARQIETAYRICYRRLHSLLAPIIRDARNVFTHNPWGEYGHEEHVLVHRAVGSLTAEYKKNVWYSNYASNWSQGLMSLYQEQSGQPTVESDVDAAILEAVAGVYRAYGAWTWFDEVRWFPNEVFVKGPLCQTERRAPEAFFPVNMLDLGERPQPAPARTSSLLRRTLRRLLGG